MILIKIILIYINNHSKVHMPLILLFILTFCFTAGGQSNSSVFIRMNQAGFLPQDIKSAVIFSKKKFKNENYSILNSKGKIISKGMMQKSGFSINNFSYCRTIDFSGISEPGDYRLRIKGAKDYYFRVNNYIYSGIRDSLMLFFQVQRCGPTDPLLHEPCHMSDATSVPGFSENSIVDVTGGWHDAGDYLKFLSTAAYTTYMLIFSYEFDPDKFGFDNDNNGVPDILEEARIGIDWLLRCHLRNDLLITQVQDLRDHDQKWRLPENDLLGFDRPGFTGIGKNIIGIYSAALAIASRIWSTRFYDYDFAAQCLETAEGTFSAYKTAPDIDTIASGVYRDISFAGKLALGAAELYTATKDSSYLKLAKVYADSAGSDFWWSWGDINSLVHYRLTTLGEDYSDYILNNIRHFNLKKDSSLFSEGTDFTWGSVNTILGTALQVILYKRLSGNNGFDSLLIFQRDYVLGRNPWGISFVHGIGKTYPVRLHSQIGFLNNGYLPGAISSGPASLQILEKYSINRSSGWYDRFNSGRIRYFDDYNDYITNEPTIAGNATGLFVFGFFSRQEYVTD